MAERETYRLLTLLFAGKPKNEAVATRVHLDAGPETVWNRIQFYEEVPARPPFLLRTLLPQPVRTEGAKTAVGAKVRCIYSTGEVVKHITAVQPPRLIEFEVIDQRLGIERVARTLGGSYHLSPCHDGTDVELVTNYRAYLRPRFLWRPLEMLLVRQLHHHILRGIQATITFPAAMPAIRSAVTESLKPECAPRGGLACTISESRSRR
jgi:hypothetical protein